MICGSAAPRSMRFLRHPDFPAFLFFCVVFATIVAHVSP
jgi:hypothetical protein